MAEIDDDRPKIKTYIKGLDEQMDGGIPAGHLVLICGTSGSMKSSVAFNILFNAVKHDDYKAVYLSLEQSRTSLLRHMKGLGMDIADVEENLAVIDLGRLRKEMRDIQRDEKLNWLNSLLSQIRNYKENIGFDVLVVDSMDALYVLSKMKEPRDELFHFYEGIRDTNITSFLISEMPGMTEHFGKYDVEAFLSDGIIHVAMERDGRSVNRFISVVKMREVKHATDYFPLLTDDGFEIVST